MHCAVVFSRSCLQLCISFPLGSHPCWPCCEDKLCPSSCWARAAVAECFVCKQNSLFARPPALPKTCCPGQSCLWTIQVCSGALALSELQGSSIWKSFWLSWQSLSLKSCLHGLLMCWQNMQEQVGILLHKHQHPHKAAIHCPGSTTETPGQAEALGEEWPVTSRCFWSVVLLPSVVLTTESQNC